MDGGRLHRLFGCQWRQNARHAGGDHGLAGARRAGKKQVMPARRGDLGGRLRLPLSCDVSEVDILLHSRALTSLLCGGGCITRLLGSRGQPAVAGDPSKGIDKRCGHQHVQPRNQQRLCRVRGRDNEGVVTLLLRRQHRRDDAGHRSHAAIKPQLPQHERRIQPFARRRRIRQVRMRFRVRVRGPPLGGNVSLPPGHIGGEDGQGHWEIEVRARLRHGGRGQRHHDLGARPRQPRVVDGGTDACPRFRNRRIGQAHDVDAWKAWAHVRFDGHLAGNDAVESYRATATKPHLRPPGSAPRTGPHRLRDPR